MPIIFSSSFDTEIKLFILDQVREYLGPRNSRYSLGPGVSCLINADNYPRKKSEKLWEIDRCEKIDMRGVVKKMLPPINN